MNIEENRLRTFASWPADARVEAKKIAKAGFFYMGNNFDVKCFFCNGIIGDWEYGDSAITRHGRLNPQCPFIIDAKNSGNVPYVLTTPSSIPYSNEPSVVQTKLNPETSEQCVQRREPSNPVVPNAETNTETASLQDNAQSNDENCRYTSLSERLASFDGWPDSVSQTPVALAIAGFFYTGVRDFVRCFECDGGLRSWQPDDDPWAEHYRSFPTCPFLQRQFRNNNSINNTTDLETAMMDETVQAALSVGINVEDVREAVRRRIAQTGTSFSNVTELVNTTMEDAGSTPLDRRHQRPTIASASMPFSAHIPLPLNVEDENRRLREARLCKICLDSELGIVFLPCGHFAACEMCAMNLTQCPLCRAKIDANVRTFLS